MTPDFPIESTGATTPLANGGTLSFVNGTGLLVMKISGGNTTGVFIIGGGTVILISQVGNGFATWDVNTSTPATGHISFYYDGAHYTVKSNLTATVALTTWGVRLNAAN